MLPVAHDVHFARRSRKLIGFQPCPVYSGSTLLYGCCIPYRHQAASTGRLVFDWLTGHLNHASIPEQVISTRSSRSSFKLAVDNFLLQCVRWHRLMSCRVRGCHGGLRRKENFFHRLRTLVSRTGIADSSVHSVIHAQSWDAIHAYPSRVRHARRRKLLRTH